MCGAMLPRTVQTAAPNLGGESFPQARPGQRTNCTNKTASFQASPVQKFNTFSANNFASRDAHLETTCSKQQRCRCPCHVCIDCCWLLCVCDKHKPKVRPPLVSNCFADNQHSLTPTTNSPSKSQPPPANPTQPHNTGPRTVADQPPCQQQC